VYTINNHELTKSLQRNLHRVASVTRPCCFVVTFDLLNDAASGAVTSFEVFSPSAKLTILPQRNISNVFSTNQATKSFL